MISTCFSHQKYKDSCKYLPELYILNIFMLSGLIYHNCLDQSVSSSRVPG